MTNRNNKISPLRWYDPLLLYTLPPVFALTIKLVNTSCKLLDVIGKKEAMEAVSMQNKGALYVSWHQRMFYSIHYLGHESLYIMISQSRDGEYAAKIASLLGFRNVRGSSTRNGTKALREQIKILKKGGKAGVLTDGPTGPPRLAKLGPVIMARNSHVPIIPVSCSYDKCWVLNSWDRYLIPKPFSRVVYCYGTPLFIPSNIRGEELESYRIKLEKELNHITDICDSFLGVKWPRSKT